MRKWLGIGFVTMLLAITLGIIMRSPGMAQPLSERDITLVNIEFEGTKIWVPGSVAVKKANTVKIRAINNVNSDPPVHGFTIEAYGIQTVVNVGKPEIIKADKAGFFPIICQLHPAHVGTQLVVLERSAQT